jgi:hypothetical protein
MTELVLTREALHDLVWSEPLKTLASKHGLDAARITQACHAAEIPLPPAGHWTKVEMNKPVERAPLPGGHPADEAVTITPPPSRTRKKTVAAPPAPGAKQTAVAAPKAKPPEPPPPATSAPAAVETIAKPRRRSDPLVRAWTEKNEQDRREARRRGWGLGSYPDLSQPLEQRRLQIYIDLFGELRSRGFTLTGEHGPIPGATATKGKHAISISIYERRTKGRRPLTPAEKQDPWNKSKSDIYQLNPTGDLVLKLKGDFYNEVVSDFRDRGDLPLASQIPEIVENVEGAIRASISRAEARAQAQQAAWEAEQERWRREQERKARAERRTRLLQQATDWRQAALLRDFIQVVRTAASDQTDANALQAWLEWAEAEADALDPITGDRINLADRG